MTVIHPDCQMPDGAAACAGFEELRGDMEKATLDRDALLVAAGFKPGPLTEKNRQVILDDIAGMRPAMVIARREGQQAQSDADLWQLFCAETEFSTGETLLLKIWKRAKKAEAALAARTTG